MTSATERGLRIKLALRERFYHWIAERADRMRVLDIGCGDGYGSRILAESSDFTVGIDTDGEHRAEWSPPRPGSGEPSFALMDGTRLGFADGCLDVVACIAFLEHLEDHGAFMEETFRVLRPGAASSASRPTGRWLRDGRTAGPRTGATTANSAPTSWRRSWRSTTRT